jgi:phenylpropionate dioxygenase-like ring-hydroxylating dioxygenase large terminal subunit
VSDLSISASALDRSRTQLSVTSYFDEQRHAREMQSIFRCFPRYLGHALALPGAGDHLALPQEAEGRALVRGPGGIQLLSNVCRHRQAVMLRGRGNTGANIVCPLHRWTYGLDGGLVGAPHFEQDPCLALRRWPVQEWNGLLFEAGEGQRCIGVELQGLGGPDFDFSGFQYHSSMLHACDYNWKTFIEVYLEDYHVVPFHPGLGRFVECGDLHWAFGAGHSVQTVGVHRALERPGTETYRRWHDAVLNHRNGAAPEHGAIWLTIYPTVMVERYPHVLVISSLFPQGPRKTLNMVEFFYPEEIIAFEPDFIEAQQAAYKETMAEDDEIAQRMDAGRAALMARGDDEAGPYQSPMEDGMQHFHEWYRRVMGEPAA